MQNGIINQTGYDKKTAYGLQNEKTVIIMHYCNADPQSRASRKVITAVSRVRDSHNNFSV